MSDDALSAERIVESLSDAVFVTTDDGVIRFANRTARELFGDDQGELAVKSWIELVSAMDLLTMVGFRYLFEETLAEGTMVSLECADGETRLLGVTVSWLRGAGEERLLLLSCRPSGAVQQELEEASRWAAVLIEKTDELEKAKAQLSKMNGELIAAQREIAAASRLAGMAEISTDILHNVGNVLNSVGVSAELVRRMMAESRLPKLRRIADHAEGQVDLGAFLAGEGGERTMRFLIQLAGHLEKEQTAMQDELAVLEEGIAHIKTLVSRQQEFATSAAVVERVTAHEVLQEAVSLTEGRRGGNVLDVDVRGDVVLITDRHRLIQILVNLVTNAYQAVSDAGNETGQVHIRAEQDAGRCQISVRDNGVGIEPENQLRIFEHGFSTRHGGRGFGLHDASNAIREMGGELSCSSSGAGEGAEFLLMLPLTAPGDSLSLHPRCQQ